MSDVKVTFGANIEKLVAGVDQIKSSISGLVETAMTFGGVLGAAFSADKLAGFIDSYGKLGEQIERSAAILGVSTTGVQELGFIAKSTGGDADSMAQAMERLQLGLQHAQTSTSQQALALKALGLSAKDLIGVPLPEQMKRIADSVAKFADGGNKTAAVLALIGRSGAQMIPVLDQGRIGLELLRQTADSIAISPANIESLAKMDRATVGLKAAISNLAAAIAGEFASSLTSAANKMTSLIGAINTAATAGTLWERALNLIATTAVAMAESEDLASDRTAISAAKAQLAGEKLELLRTTGVRMLTDLMGHANTTKNSFDEMWNAMLGIGKKLQMPAMDEGAANAAKAAAEQYDVMIKQATGAYAVLKAQYSTDAAVHKITVDQETAQLMAALDQRWAIEQALFEAKKALYAGEPAQLGNVLKQENAAYQAYLKEHTGLTDTQLKADVAQWQGLLTPLESAWNSQLRGLLAGTETWATAMKKIFGDLVIQVIEYFEKIAVEKAALGLATAFGAGPQSLLGGLFGGSGGSAALTTAGTTLTSAGTLLNTAALSLNTAAAALTAGAAGNVAAPLDLAAVAALDTGGTITKSGLAMVHQYETVLPRFDVGTNYVLKSGLAMIHEGNSITPARGSGPFTGAGDTHHHYNFNISTPNTRDMARALMDNDSAVMKAVRSAIKRGAHLQDRHRYGF
ncbi:MAG: hypothetical protein ACLPX7_02555 [Xanthobacteraceae bacterium]